MPVLTMLVIKKPALEGNFVSICEAHPIEPTTNKVYAAEETMQFANDGQTQLWVENQEFATPTVITFVPPEQLIENLVSFEAVNQAWTVPADSLVSFGPFSRGIFNNAVGNLVFTVSVTANVLVWARSASR